MTWRLGDRKVERMLVTRLRYLGDVVMTTAVIEALRRGDDRLDIGYLCEEAYAPVLEGHPDLARVHALAVRRRGADARARPPAGSSGAVDGATRALGPVALVRALRAVGYDTAVDLFFNPRSAWLLKFAGMPGRLAGPAGSRGRLYTHRSDAAHVRLHARWEALAPGGLGDHLARLSPLTHVESGLDFSEWFLVQGVRARTRLAPRPGAPGRVEKWAAASGIVLASGIVPAPGFLVLAPAATWATKRWPVGHWCALAARLAMSWPGQVVVLTAPGDEAASAAIAAALPAGRGAALPPLPLPEALDVIAAAAGLVTVDGGIMHAAVALRTPTLALFGPTDPRLWFPYEGTGPFQVLARRPACHPCDLHACGNFICLPELSPAEVAARALALFRPGVAGSPVDGPGPSPEVGP